MTSIQKTITFTSSNLIEAQTELENLDPKTTHLELKIDTKDEKELYETTMFIFDAIEEVPENQVEVLYLGCPGFDFSGYDSGLAVEIVSAGNPKEDLFQNAFPHLKELETETWLWPNKLKHENLRVFKQKMGSILPQDLIMPHLQYFYYIDFGDVHGVAPEYNMEWFSIDQLPNLKVLDVSKSTLYEPSLFGILKQSSHSENLSVVISDDFLFNEAKFMEHVEDLKQLNCLMLTNDEWRDEELKRQLGDKIQFIDHLETEWNGDDLQVNAMRHLNKKLVKDEKASFVIKTQKIKAISQRSTKEEVGERQAEPKVKDQKNLSIKELLYNPDPKLVEKALKRGKDEPDFDELLKPLILLAEYVTLPNYKSLLKPLIPFAKFSKNKQFDQKIRLAAKSISKLFQITEIDLEHKKHIPEEIGLFSQNLTKLACSNWYLGNLPKSLADLKNLTYFRIGTNHMSRYRKVEELEFLPHLKKLEYLKLGRIEGLPEGMENLKRLKELSIETRQKTIFKEVFELSSLESLHISAKFIKNIPNQFHKTPHLKKVVFGTFIKSLPKSFLNLKNLENLHITGLNKFPAKIDQLIKLKRLNIYFAPKLRLGFLQFKTLPNNILNLKHLVELNIIDGYLEELPNQINKLSNLKHLDLRGNKLKKIPKAIGKLKNLITLDISRNRVEKFPESLKELTNLKKLNLSNNKIEEIPKIIGELKSLKELVLMGNEIDQLPEEISQLTQLQALFIDHPYPNLKDKTFKKLPQHFSKLKNLKKLQLNIENLDYTKEELKKIIPKDCNCEYYKKNSEGYFQLERWIS